MEPIVWLATPFVVTAVIAVVLWLRTRELGPEQRRRRQQAELRALERALRPHVDRIPGQ